MPRMHTYGGNKFKTALEMRARIENWPAAWSLRLRRNHQGLALLRFRDGFNVVCRGGTRDWDVVYELMFADSYRMAFEHLRATSGPATVVDLGGNIGLFSLIAAAQQPQLMVHAFEPGPPNYRLFEINRLANSRFTDRIVLHREAVGGQARTTNWFFDEANPGGSSLFGTGQGASFEVKISAFRDVIAATEGPIALVKIDIEGAEFEILQQTPAETWARIPAIALELHDDPERKISQPQFLDRMRALGYDVREEKVCSYFLVRR